MDENNYNGYLGYLGYLKYSGDLVQDGLFDAKKSAQALLGFDDAVRFFLEQQIPELKGAEYDFPVRIRQGSWEILVPAAVTAIIAAYGMAAAKKMAENDFAHIGMKDVLIKSLKAIQWFMRLGKHMGDLTIKQFKSTRWQNNNHEIGIPNANGEYLFLPKEFLELYVSSNPKLISKIAILIEDERKLTIGVNDNGLIEEEVLSRKYRIIFTNEEDSDDTLFPELTHGLPVVLEGEVTRGNEETNTLGLRYKGHIVTCVPKTGSVVQYKECIFLPAMVHGIISRTDECGGFSSKRPRIIFSYINPLQNNEPGFLS
jgi:hypothetical protein